MNKGLEALKELGEMTLASEYGDEPKVKGLVLYDAIEKELRAFDAIRKYVWKGYRNNNVDNDLRDIKKQLEAVRIIKKYRHFDVRNGDLVVHVPDGDEEDKEYKLLEEVFADE